MLVACLAASRKKRGLDAIDKAFWKALKHYPDTKDVLPSFKVLSFAPFDPVSKKVVAVVESPRGECIECVKGAPPSVFKMVKEANEIPEAVAKKYHETVAEFARRGFRSLGVARKRAKGPWELLGIMPCSDPPRHDTAKTVKEALALGLKIKMLTGDAVGIAKETSRQLGLGENIYNSERLGLTGGGDMPGSKIYDYVEAADGFAEVFPQHKYNVVDVLQKRGHLVAMTGDGVNDAPSLKRADTGIAVEGSSDAARSAADIVFLAPGLSAIIDALKISRQIFHRMYAYVVYRIALSIHLELFLGLWIAYYGDIMQVQLVIFIAIFADIATLAIAYDNAPYSPKPVKWNLPLLWGTAIPMGFILFAGTWVCLRTLPEPAWHWADSGKVPAWQGQNPKTPDSINGTFGIVEGKGLAHSIIFLEIVLTENWLIFITRAGNRPFWSPMPSWQLLVAIFLVDVLATVFCVLGWFNGGRTTAMTSPLTIVRVWMFSLGVFCVMAGVYHILATSRVYNCLLHLKWPFKRSRGRRQFEDFGQSLFAQGFLDMMLIC
jgi:H+-transporting ATPase